MDEICAWCGNACYKIFMAQRVRKLVYVDITERTTIEDTYEELYFCTRGHRWAYCEGP